MPHGEGGPPLDAGGAIADNPIEVLAQFVDHTRDAFFAQSILIPGLRRVQKRERVDALVANERLRKFGIALNDVN